MRVIGALIAVAIAAATIPDGSWLLGYEGKSTAAALNDRRLAALVRDRVPTVMSGRVLVGLAVNPEPVVVTGARFVSLSGCRASDCLEKGFLWVDTASGEALAVAYAASPRRDVLTIGSKGISASKMPAEATASIVEWLTTKGLDPDVVEFIGPSNVPVAVNPQRFQPKSRGR